MKKLCLVIAILVAVAIFVSACGPTAPDCTKAEVVCAALVTDVGKVTDKSFNQSSWEALQQAKDEGLVQWIQYIETSDAKDYGKNMSTFGDAGYDIIVTSGYNAGLSSMAAAKVYPTTMFICVDQPASIFTPVGDTTPANYVGILYKEDQSGFLVGALAAKMSATHKIGAVAGLSSIPPVWRYGEGYKAGAAYADEQDGTTTEVTVTYHDDVTIATAFTDPVWGKTTADSMLSKGVDVIFGIGGTTGNSGPEEAAAQQKYAIGVDKDQYYELTAAAPYLLTSAMKNIKLDDYTLIKSVLDGTFPGGEDYMGTNGMAPYHDLDSVVPAAVKTAMEAIQAGLANDTIVTGVPVMKP